MENDHSQPIETLKIAAYVVLVAYGIRMASHVCSLCFLRYCFWWNCWILNGARVLLPGDGQLRPRYSALCRYISGNWRRHCRRESAFPYSAWR